MMDSVGHYSRPDIFTLHINRSAHLQVRVREVIPETADACSIVLDAPADRAEQFAYRPGQFLTLQLPGDAGPVARSYSLCSSPDVDDAGPS